MGSLHAEEFADAVRSGSIGLRMALSFHIRTNFYPPLPNEYVDVAIEALDLIATEDGGDVELPNVEILPRQAYKDDGGKWWCDAWTLVQILHLEAFAEIDEEE